MSDWWKNQKKLIPTKHNKKKQSQQPFSTFFDTSTHNTKRKKTPPINSCNNSCALFTSSSRCVCRSVKLKKHSCAAVTLQPSSRSTAVVFSKRTLKHRKRNAGANNQINHLHSLKRISQAPFENGSWRGWKMSFPFLQETTFRSLS